MFFQKRTAFTVRIPTFSEPTSDTLVPVCGRSEMGAVPGRPLTRCDRADEILRSSRRCKSRICGSMIHSKPTPTIIGHVITMTRMLVGVVNADRRTGWRFFHGAANIADDINLFASVLPLAREHQM